MIAMRTLANRPGITYDEAKTSVIFAEDLNNIKANILELAGLQQSDDGDETVAGNKHFTGLLKAGAGTYTSTRNLAVFNSMGFHRTDTGTEVASITASPNGISYSTTISNSNQRHIFTYNNGAEVFRTASFRMGIGVNDPKAILHLKAGEAGVNTAPLKLNAGVNNTTPENGAIEFDGSKITIVIGGVRKEFAFV